MELALAETAIQSQHVNDFGNQIKNKSDKLVNYFILSYFLIGLFFATFYDTWSIALYVGLPLISSYYVSKMALPNSNFYQYLLSVVLGLFMAQFIFQLHGMFEMHFFAFVGAAVLITYQNWKLQIPIAIVVGVHHALFAYLQFSGIKSVYFTQLPYMDIFTFVVHFILACSIFFLCGLWAYDFKKYSERHIDQTFELGKLQQNEEQNKKLRKTNEELDKFAYSVSHDLRAPLLSMQGLIEFTEMETEEELTKVHMVMLKESVSKLDRFVSDILDYSRNSRLKVRSEPIDFKKLVQSSIEQLAYMNGGKFVDISMDVECGCSFFSDQHRLMVVLNNLISNAIRYKNNADPNPKVKVSVSIPQPCDNALIVVEDNGIGISSENQAKIFDMFYRVSEQSAGSGLGLYIVKETLDVLNGSIQIDSVIGRGTKFILTIPNNNAE